MQRRLTQRSLVINGSPVVDPGFAAGGIVTVPPSTSQHGFLAQRVAAHSADLTAAEARVARFLAEHPDDVAFASASELGALTATSDATVIRTVKALGYPGLPALKRLLQETVRGRLTPAGRLNRSLDEAGDDPAAVLSHVLDDHIRLLEEARQTLIPADFSHATAIITEARQTVVFGLGVLGYLAEYFALRLSRLGHAARTATASGFLAADALLDLGNSDALLIIAHTSLAPETDTAISHAHRVGAKTVLLTDNLAEALRDRVAATLTTPIGATGSFSTQAATLAILEALVLATAAAQRDQATQAMTLLNQLRGELRGIGSTAASASP
jgi:DNA-binding MurR/RpiR family transcriptional regulator